MILRILFSAACVLASLTAAESCQTPLRKGTTEADWPSDIYAARVKVLSVRTSKDRERQWTRLRVIEPLKGDFPAEVGVLSTPDAASCGYGFTKGDEFIVGLMRRKGASPSERYQYTANTWTETWTQFVYGYQH
jgi:hypothetical protein